jgi:peptidoglycan/LPS O-acetylase OafA/YrhL
VAAIAIVLLLAIEGDRHALGELAGGMSYPLYLNAWVAVFTVNALFKHVLKHDNAFARLTLVFVSSLILAAFLYWHVDRRILANRRRLYTPARAKAVIRVAYGAVAVGLLVGVVLYNRI